MEMLNKKILDDMNDWDYNLFFGKLIRYKNVVQPKYLSFYIPTIEKHYDDDYEYGESEFRGFLLGLKHITTKIKIGTEIVRVPVYKKNKGRVVNFKRYV